MASDLQECPRNEGVGSHCVLQETPPLPPLQNGSPRARRRDDLPKAYDRRSRKYPWTVESLTELLTSNGYARRLAAERPLFVVAPPLPQAGRPGEPRHPRTDCLVWTGPIRDGYGRIKGVPVHVLTMRLAGIYVPPPGLWAAHRCERPMCGHPGHAIPKGLAQ